MIIVMGEVRFGDGEIERLKPALRDQHRRRSRAEAGLRALRLWRSTCSTRTCSTIAEEWSDEEAIDAHMQRRIWPS